MKKIKPVYKKIHSPASVNISRWHNNVENLPIAITVEDVKTGKIVSQVRMPLEDFASAVTAAGPVPGTLVTYRKLPVKKSKEKP